MNGPVYDPLVGNKRYEFISWWSPTGKTVVNARDCESNQNVTVKIIDRGPDVNRNVEREVLNHSQLKNVHVIELYEAFLTPKHLCIVQEPRETTLWNYVHTRDGPLDEGMVQYLFVQMLDAVSYCHSAEVVNRDIKLDSCAVKHLYSNATPYLWVKVCDFEYCKNTKHNSMPKSMVGTAAYLCLDVIESQIPEIDSNTYHGEPVDVWNLGISLYFLLEGCFPFGTELSTDGGFMDLVHRIETLAMRPCQLASEGASDLIYKILCAREHRINLEGVKDHWWVRQAYQRDDVKELEALIRRVQQPSYPTMSTDSLKEMIKTARMPARL